MNQPATRCSAWQGFCDFGTGDANTHYPDTNGFIQDNFGSTIKRTSTNAVGGLNQYHLYQVETKTNGWNSRVNGTNVLVATNNTVQFDTAPTIGKGGSFYFQGNIAEILIFTNILSSNQNFTVTNYLKQKYNLP